MYAQSGKRLMKRWIQETIGKYIPFLTLSNRNVYVLLMGWYDGEVHKLV